VGNGQFKAFLQCLHVTDIYKKEAELLIAPGKLEGQNL
jgi:hypothetical protein